MIRIFKTIVAGSRDFTDYSLLESELIDFLRPLKPNEVEIVSGAARGADKLGEQFANNKGCHLKLFPADWGTYGKSAGYRCNAEMASYADACVVFWDGKSRCTKHMIDLVKQENLKLKVVMFN